MQTKNTDDINVVLWHFANSFGDLSIMNEYFPEKIHLSKSFPARSSGFTLLEILVAIAIVAILSAISFPVYNSYIDKAKITLGISTLETIRKTFENYHSDYSSYPLSIDLATGEDGQGHVVLQRALLDEFKQHLSSMDSYFATTSDYTLTARAIDSKHTTLVLTPGQVVTQGP